MSFERLLKPRSIAVFGGAQAQEVIRQGDRMRFKGEIWPVYPKKTEVEGRPVYRSVEDLPGSPDAAYIGVNRHLTIDIVRDLADRDAGGALCKMENDHREADVEIRDGSIMGIEEASKVTKPCRYCELACPVAQGVSR